MDIKVLTIVALVHTIAAVNSLKCYECINCSTITSKQLVECGGELISTTSPSSTALTPTTTANNTTQPPLTTQPPTNNSTTNSSLTTQPSTNSTTEPPVTTQPSTNSTTNSSLTTQPTTNNTTNPPLTTEQTATNRTRHLTLLQHSRSKRDHSFVSPKNIFEESFERRKKPTVTYYCYKATVKYNKTYNIVQRGCAEKIYQNETLCDKVPKEIEVKACTTCESDQCNGAFTKHLSFFTMILLFLSLTV